MRLRRIVGLIKTLMRRLSPIYTGFILIGNPALWGCFFGFLNSIFYVALLSETARQPFETPIRAFSFFLAAMSPLLIWPVAGLVLGADLFHWRFGSSNEK